MWGGPAERQTDNEAGQEQECNGSGQAPSHQARAQVTSSVRFPHTAADNLGRPGTVSPDGKWSDIWAVRAPGSISQHCVLSTFDSGLGGDSKEYHLVPPPTGIKLFRRD